MTVEQLIKDLEKMPQDYEVVFYIDDDDYLPPRYDVDEIDVNHKKRQIELF